MIEYMILVNGVIAATASFPHSDAAETWVNEFCSDGEEDGTLSEDDEVALIKVE